MPRNHNNETTIPSSLTHLIIKALVRVTSYTPPRPEDDLDLAELHAFESLLDKIVANGLDVKLTPRSL